MSSVAHSTDAPLPAIELVGATRWLKAFSWGLAIGLVLLAVLLLRVPWRQNLPGFGRVIEFDPVNRPMPLQARTDGLIMTWHVREGDHVEAGQKIVDLADNDPEILQRLEEQMAAAEAKRDAAQRKVEAYSRQVEEAMSAREAAIRMADHDVEAAVQSVVAARQEIAVAEENIKLAEFQQTMFDGLIAKEIAPGIELERARQQLGVEKARLEARRAQVGAAEANLRARQSARQRIERDEQVKIQGATGLQRSAEGEVAEADASIQRLKVTLQRQRQQALVAPVAGTVQNLMANGQGGGFVKAGANLAMLVPDSAQLAVELIVDGNDVTFIEVGSHVRLQFEGWPAVQFVGWPSAAVGTFGGKVAFVDRFDSGDGQFRVMVLPDERPFSEEEGAIARTMREVLTIPPAVTADNPHAWPDGRWLRQGVNARGWVLLKEVPLWFEFWRRFNGFPPSLEKPKEYGTPKLGRSSKGDDAKDVEDGDK